MKILVVDDEQIVRWFLERALRKWGHEVVSVSNGQEALGHVTRSSFDVLFTDLRMPEGNGANLLKSVSEMANKSPKIVVCSAFVTPEMTEEFRRKGISVLKKPFKLAELENTLRLSASSAS